MKILKFGGTSIGSVATLGKMIQIVHAMMNEPVILVFSAFGETTDVLIQMANLAVAGKLAESRSLLQRLQYEHIELAEAFLPTAEAQATLNDLTMPYFAKLSEMLQGLATLRDFSPPVQDAFLSHGELLSTTILNLILQQQGLPTEWVDSRNFMITNSRFTQAEPRLAETQKHVEENLLPVCQRGKIPVVAGYIARNADGRTTTLGRGGSDYTAAILAALIQAEEVQIWTDVDGIMTADPSLVPTARPIRVMSFQEDAELAYFGARVLHPKTITPAMEKKIPVRVRNTFRPQAEGTWSLAEPPSNGHLVKSIAYKEGMKLITILSTRMFKAHGFLKRIFEVFDAHRVPLDLVTTSEVSVAIAVLEIPNRDEIVQELQAFGKVDWQEQQAVVCVVGEQIRRQPGIAGQIFAAIPEVPISMISQGGSEINISFVCDENHLPYVIRNLHQTFFPEENESVN